MKNIIHALAGNATETEVEVFEELYGELLIEGESILRGFKLLRDSFLFTDKRLIIIDKQGVTGKKIEFHSVPYKSITQFSTETAGSFDGDCELKIWVSGVHDPIKKEFRRGSDIMGIQKMLASAVL